MKIQIIKILDESTKQVLCKSKFGTFEVSWSGELPIEGERHDVELDVEGTIEVKELCPCILSSDKGITILQGEAELVCSDTLCIIRLGHYIIQVESKNDHVTPGDFVRVVCDKLVATSYRY